MLYFLTFDNGEPTGDERTAIETEVRNLRYVEGEDCRYCWIEHVAKVPVMPGWIHCEDCHIYGDWS